MPLLTGSLLWGTNFENVLSLGWPLDSLRPGRLPRAGSEWGQAPSGVEDAWITGRDYVLDGMARWAPYADQTVPVVQSGWAGSRGVQAFLDYAYAKNTFRYVPDQTNPLFYVDGCYLDFAQPDVPTIEADGSLQTHLRIRNPTIDFGLALRGLLFEYAPGGDISPQGLNGLFSGGGGGFYNNVGFFEAAAAGTLMDRHYPLGLGAGGPLLPRATLLQPAATNKLTAPENLSNAAWVKTNATIPSTNNPSPRAGDLTASFLREDTSATTNHWAAQSFTITAGHTVGGTRFVRSNGRIKLEWVFGNANLVGMTSFFGVIIDTVAGTATPVTTGSGVVTFSSIAPLGGNWWAVTLYGQVDGSSTTIWDVNALMSGAATSYTGDGVSGMLIWGCVATDNQPAGVYWGTGASRVAADLSFGAVAPWQGLFLFVDYIEMGASAMAAGVAFLAGLAAAGGGTPRVVFDVGGNTSTFYNQSGVGPQVSSSLATSPVPGDRVQLLGLLNPNGSVKILRSLNLGADASGSTSAVLAFSTTPAARVFFNGLGSVLAPHNLIAAKVGLLTMAGQTVDTVAKARVV